jgi:hypothetical protein
MSMPMLALLTSPAALTALTAAIALPSLTGFPTWPAFARGRLASTLCPSLAVGALAFALVQRLTAPPPG